MEESNSVQLKTYIDASIEKVWKTITSPEGMKEWLGPKEYEPRVGGKIRFEVQPGPHKFIITGEIQEMVLQKRISFTWLEEKVGSYKWPCSTLVEINLRQFHTGTLVTLEHSGFKDLPSEIALSEFLGHLTGWTIYHYPFADLPKCIAKYGG